MDNNTIKLTQSSLNDKGEYVLKWEKDDGADGYSIYKRNEYIKTFALVTHLGKDCFEFSDKNAIKGLAQYYQVKSFTEQDKKKTAVNCSDITTLVTLENARVNKVKKTLLGTVKIKLEIIANVTGYIISRSINGKEFEEVFKTKSNTEIDFKDKLPKGSKTYEYKVACYKKVSDKESIGEFFTFNK